MSKELSEMTIHELIIEYGNNISAIVNYELHKEMFSVAYEDLCDKARAIEYEARRRDKMYKNDNAVSHLRDQRNTYECSS